MLLNFYGKHIPVNIAFCPFCDCSSQEALWKLCESVKYYSICSVIRKHQWRWMGSILNLWAQGLLQLWVRDCGQAIDFWQSMATDWLAWTTIRESTRITMINSWCEYYNPFLQHEELFINVKPKTVVIIFTSSGRELIQKAGDQTQLLVARSERIREDTVPNRWVCQPISHMHFEAVLGKCQDFILLCFCVKTPFYKCFLKHYCGVLWNWCLFHDFPFISFLRHLFCHLFNIRTPYL